MIRTRKSRSAKVCGFPDLRSCKEFWTRTSVSWTRSWNGQPCWIWLGTLQRDGYGYFARLGRFAQRVCYEAYVGPLADGITLDHQCGDRRCVNPAHFEAVPHSLNARRAHEAKAAGRCVPVVRPKTPRKLRLCREFWIRTVVSWTKFWNGSPCWSWVGGTKGGYGSFCVGKKKYVKAHRFSYELYRERIGRGFVIDHLCENKLCVNPDHLAAVTNEENTMRAVHPTSINRAKTHCKRGHRLDGKNVIWRHDGGRQCRTCYTVYQKAYHDAHSPARLIPEQELAAVQAERGVTREVAARTIGIRRYIAGLSKAERKRRTQPTHTPTAIAKRRAALAKAAASLTPDQRRTMVSAALKARWKAAKSGNTERTDAEPRARERCTV